MLTRIAFALLAAVFACSLFAAPALAQRDRVFVASYGSDSNPCTFGSPCKTFQNAINVVAQGGEVTAIDSAGFGTFSISHAVTITSPNGVEAGIAAPESGDAAITINAGPSDIIHLGGLTLDGDGVSNTTGIAFNSGGSLNIQNSVIRNFTNYGIAFAPNASSQLFVSNTLIADNGNSGILFILGSSGTATGALNHVEMDNNASYGLFVISIGQVGNVTVSDSVSANNGIGIGVRSNNGTTINIMVRNSSLANNGTDGLQADGSGANIWVTRSTINGNGSGWHTDGVGTVTTFGDNNIVGNGANNNSPSAPVTYQ
jgi:hypothetical protein